MRWVDWVLVGFFSLSVLVTIRDIGKPRNPITPGLAIATLIFGGAFICMIIVWRPYP